MKVLFRQLTIQFKMDLREKGTLLTFYLVPLVFFAVMGAVFSSINPDAKKTLTATMAIFAITMGAVLGVPAPLVTMRNAGVLRAFKVNGIPGWSVLLIQALSAFLHLLIVSTVILVSAPLLFGADVPASIGGYLLVLCLILFASVTIGLLIGTVAKSQSSATMLSQAVFLPSLMLSGIMFPASMLPEVLNLAGKVLPATHAMNAFSQLAFQTGGSGNAFLSLVIILAIGILAVLLATVLFRKNAKG